MKTPRLFLIILLLSSWMQLNAQPLILHPENRHYFEYKGKPTLIISSAEHYGAVINGAFDYHKYLGTLHAAGMNYTRIFTGSYIEIPGAFGIGHNTLAPEPANLIMPWKQVNEPGAYPDDKKYDLDQWNPRYFDRLRDVVREAEALDIFVEITLFSSNYTDRNWTRNPFNDENSVNHLPDINRKEVNTLKNGKILRYQQALVKKIVTELNGFDNVIYEIQNEPWADQTREGMLIFKTVNLGGSNWQRMSELATPASYDWQIAMANLIIDTESALSQRHLIAQNYCNQYDPLATVNPAIDILNFHYAWPEASTLNYGWDHPVSFDESGFSENSGMGDSSYLRQAWEFMLAGGAVFNNLDYSFYCGYEDGEGQNKAPGGGSATLRKQLHFLRVFMDALDFIHMKPDCAVVTHAPGMRAQALAEKGKQYAIVFTEMTNDWVTLTLPEGTYHYAFFSPFTGETLKEGRVESDGTNARWEMPKGVTYMVALKINKQ